LALPGTQPVQTSQSNDLQSLRLSGREVTVTVMPRLGGKVSSIVWCGHELLFQNPERPLRPASYGASYADFDASGFDECLPSIGACRYPTAPWQGIPVPDHGELWPVPWSAVRDSNALHLAVDGIQFPYSLRKSIELLPDAGIRFRYRFHNRSASPFPFIWAAHPLLAVEEGDRIHLPEPLNVIVDWSRNERLGEQFTVHPWPIALDREGRDVDMRLIGGPDLGFVEKLYTTRLAEGWCGVHGERSGRWVAMIFSTGNIPFVGLSINQGGWPVEGRGYFNLGLEPCNGFPDRLDLAVERGAYALARPDETLEWEFALYAGKATAFPAERVRSLAAELVAA
jgi:hypothetical protein